MIIADLAYWEETLVLTVAGGTVFITIVIVESMCTYTCIPINRNIFTWPK
jgi:hypothetical protein